MKMPASEALELLSKPLLFEPNRVWRVYKGGKLLDQLRGISPEQDNDLPEEWLASITPAMNGENQQSESEGLSRIRLGNGTEGPLLRDVLDASNDESKGVNALCKFLDSAMRLPLQCHPDRAFSQKHLNSPFGKTESWFVLNTREVNGEEPYLLLGFREDTDEQKFRKAIMDEDIPAAISMMHRWPVKPGDAWFIPGRLPHAIGPGLLVLEVQEPSDWVVQPERMLGDFELNYESMWGPLDTETGLDCFDYTGKADADTIAKRYRLQPENIEEKEGFVRQLLIGLEQTDCFRVERLQVGKDVEISESAKPTIMIAVQGSGTLIHKKGTEKLKTGDTLLLPAGEGTFSLKPTDGLELYAVSS